MSGENGVLYSSNDGSTWAENFSGLTDLLNGLVSYTNGFYFINSAISGLRTFYSISFSSSGGQENSTSAIIFNTASLVNHAFLTITNSSSMAFPLTLDNSYQFYNIVMLHKDTMTGNPFFYGNLYLSTNGHTVIPISMQKIQSYSFAEGVLTLQLTESYSGDFVLSYSKQS